MDDRPVYTITDLTRLGPLGRTSIYEAIASGQLVARKIGRRTLVLRDDYETFLQRLPKIASRPLAPWVPGEDPQKRNPATAARP
jgi:hypothetical protein